MSDRELDAQVAKHLGYKVEWLDKIVLDPWHPEYLDGNPAYSVFEQPEPFIIVEEAEKVYDFVLAYSSDDFPAVKHEIEQRGWDWECWSRHGQDAGRIYTFYIYEMANMAEGSPIGFYQYQTIGQHTSTSEGVAVCKAFVMACNRSQKDE